MARLIATPSQTIGPFFRVGLWQPEWSDLTRHGAQGSTIHIEGSVLDGDGQPVPDALVEIWQADERGIYAHADDPRATPGDKLFRGFGRCGTDANGRYRFTTIFPGVVPGDDGAQQAPHVNMTIFARGMLRHVVTRLYFSDRAGQNASDAVLRSIEDAKARETLIARRVDTAGPTATYVFDVHLQGEGETAFFEI